jgi:predicted dehydrogenase
MSGTKNVAVVGAGPWGKNHVRQFHALGRLGGIVEASAALREKMAAEYAGVPVYASLDEMLAVTGEKACAAVVIATPAGTHAAVARQALEADRDVLVEKPMTLATAEAEGLVRLAEARGRVLMVGHLLLFQPAIRWIAQFLREDGLGRVRTISQTRINFGRARAEENALWSLGVHDVAVVLELLGEAPTAVWATGAATLTEGVEDDVRLTLRFPSGATAFVHSSWLSPTRRRELVIVGEKGMLVFDELARTVTLHKKTFDAKLTQTDGGEEVVFRQEEEPLKLEAEHFLARLDDRARPIADGRQGVAVVAVMEEASRQLGGKR